MPPKNNKEFDLQTEKKLLSVIVPIYKQEKTIEQDLGRIEDVLKQMPCDYEIIAVVNGMTDKSYENAKKVRSTKVKVYSLESPAKGYAVRYGMARSKGDPVAFIDSGMDINPRGIPLLYEHMKWYDSDIIVGSIRHSASIVSKYPLKRKILSFGYHTLTKIIFGLNITDSQRGIKIFRRKVLEKVLPRLLVKQFAFDIEMLSVANYLGFKKIHDGPVELDASKYKNSTIRFNTFLGMIRDTLAVFYRLKILHYYDDDAKRKWVYDKDLDMRINV